MGCKTSTGRPRSVITSYTPPDCQNPHSPPHPTPLRPSQPPPPPNPTTLHLILSLDSPEMSHVCVHLSHCKPVHKLNRLVVLSVSSTARCRPPFRRYLICKHAASVLHGGRLQKHAGSGGGFSFRRKLSTLPVHRRGGGVYWYTFAQSDCMPPLPVGSPGGKTLTWASAVRSLKKKKTPRSVPCLLDCATDLDHAGRQGRVGGQDHGNGEDRAGCQDRRSQGTKCRTSAVCTGGGVGGSAPPRQHSNDLRGRHGGVGPPRGRGVVVVVVVHPVLVRGHEHV